MNTTDQLSDYIRNTWQELRRATKDEDWSETQRVFRKMLKLQELHEQSLNLQQMVAGLSDEKLSDGRSMHDRAASIIHHSDETRRGTVRPKLMRIGTEELPISINNQIVTATANWIIKKGKALPRIANFIHPTDSGFSHSAQIKRLNDGSFIEIGDSQNTLIQKSRKLLNTCGFRDIRLEILFEDGTSKSA